MSSDADMGAYMPHRTHFAKSHIDGQKGGSPNGIEISDSLKRVSCSAWRSVVNRRRPRAMEALVRGPRICRYNLSITEKEEPCTICQTSGILEHTLSF